MKVLVTGGSGFVGSSLIPDLLTAGHVIGNYDLRQSEGHSQLTQIGDVRDGEALIRATAGFEVVVHLAAQHRDDVRPKSLYYDVNVGGAKRVVEAAEANAIKTIVFTSTVAVYGLNGGVPDETSPVRPFNDYGKSKFEAEGVFQLWAAAGADRSLVIVRPCVIFGESNRGNVYTLLKQIKTGRFVAIGSGKNCKSMAYVKNVSRFLADCLSLDPGAHLFNYADKPDMTTADLVRTACDALGRKAPPKIPYALGLAGGYAFDTIAAITRKTYPISAIRVRKFCADTRVAASRVNAVGFAPVYSQEEGLRRMIAHEFQKGRD